MKKENLVPLFKVEDVGGVVYMVTNNIINYLIIIMTLSNVLKWPDDIVYGYVIPGISVGLFLGGLYYAYMGYKLSKKENRADVTAIPSGVSTPAMFVMLYGVVVPLNYALEDPKLAWSASMAACLIGGFVEFCGGIVGPWIKNNVPRAALFGTVAGIGFVWMATQGLFDVYADPIVGLPILIVAMLGFFGGYLFPKKIPPLLVALVGGIVYALALGRTSINFEGVGLYTPNPVTAIQNLVNGFVVVIPYLTAIIPVEIYNVIETVDNVEAANVAGDDYSVRETSFVNGICTMISALFGGIIPNSIWLGHAGLKKSGTGIGYSIISAVILLLAGVFGLFTFLNNLVPRSVCAVTFLWCSIVMVAQAFKECKVKHYAAVGIAMIPPFADYIFSEVTGALGVMNVFTEIQASGLNEYTIEMTDKLVNGGVMWEGIPAVKSGAILVGVVLGTLTVYIIDNRLDRVALTLFVGAALSFFGLIHNAQMGIFPTSPFVIGYIVSGILALALHFSHKNKKLLEIEEDFEYV
ncbi:xanthine/uracil/vitamin C permease [Miniphocaeibacter massiliensis]|uniref:xanthine/uracil/vitamin C permease n=1 Tax=Miniphocaeibacter massiliensis TaxID=2041841 RepID=UPI001F5CD1E6|nr:xanthine/uracil/vitamin C permease [Miniphocaeibacter massiliensis]